NRYDYKPIGANLKPFANPGISGAAQPLELFNGNIAAMSVNIPKLSALAGGNNGGTLLYNYKYDQLNRLTKTYVYSGLNAASNSWNKSATDDYREQLSYDANGNILTYRRNGTTSNGMNLLMDNMSYKYKSGTNQLDHVDDAV